MPVVSTGPDWPNEQVADENVCKRACELYICRKITLKMNPLRCYLHDRHKPGEVPTSNVKMYYTKMRCVDTELPPAINLTSNWAKTKCKYFHYVLFCRCTTMNAVKHRQLLLNIYIYIIIIIT